MTKKELFTAVQNGEIVKFRKNDKEIKLIKCKDSPKIGIYLNGAFKSNCNELEFSRSKLITAKDINNLNISDISIKEDNNTATETTQASNEAIEDKLENKNEAKIEEDKSNKSASHKQPKVKATEASIKYPKFEYKIEGDTITVIGDYTGYCDSDGKLTDKSPINFKGNWSDFKLDKTSISAVASTDDCELWSQDKLVYKKLEQYDVYWYFGSEQHKGIVSFKRAGDKIEVSAEDEKVHLIFENGVVDLETASQIKTKLIEENYDITKCSILN